MRGFFKVFKKEKSTEGKRKNCIRETEPKAKNVFNETGTIADLPYKITLMYDFTTSEFMLIERPRITSEQSI